MGIPGNLYIKGVPLSNKAVATIEENYRRCKYVTQAELY